ncbi:MAG: PAS domain S-box protein, partial [Proteobacteria bacterium]|nr:PAS domain S-box protein [Pseudomonadota bacterium]
MDQKPIYEELEQKVKELENKALERYRPEDGVERIFNLSLDMIGSGNLDGYFTKINSSFGSILGYTEEEFLEKPFISFVHDHDIEKTKEALAEAGKGKQNIHIENRYKCKDGSYKWIEWKVLSIVQENKFIAVGRDITARKQAEAALRASQHMLHTVLDAIPTAVFWKDRDSFYIGGNRTWLTAAGLNSSEEVVGKSDYELPWHKEQANSFREGDRRVMETGLSEYNIIEPYRKADGTQAWAKTNKVPLRDMTGNIVGVLGTYEDITEHKRAEEALRASESRLHRTITELSAIINTLPGMISVTDLDYNILVANHHVIEKFGHSCAEEVIGKKCYEVRKGRDSVCPECGVKRALETGETFVRFSTPQEENMMGISTKAYAAPIRNGKGIVWGAVEVIMDITDMRKAEEELILLATAIEQASESIIISDKPGTVQYVNPAFELISGFNREEIIGQNFRILKSDKHTEAFYKEMYDIISRGNIWV